MVLSPNIGGEVQGESKGTDAHTTLTAARWLWASLAWTARRVLDGRPRAPVTQ